MRAARALAAALLLALAGCGFQLRGSIDLPFETLHLDGMPYSPFTGQLRRTLSASSTRVVDNAEEASAVVHLLGEAQERAILAVSGAGRVRELQLRYRVSFRVADPVGNEWLPQDEVLVVRDMTYDDSQILAKEGEAQTLFREMQSDAVQQVLRRLQAVRPASRAGGQG